jgi:heme oxygenase
MLQASSLLPHLKTSTAFYHAQLDRHPRLIKLLKPDLDKNAYTEILKKFYGFYAPIESHFDQNNFWETLALSKQLRLKMPLLEKELEYLGINISTIPRTEWMSSSHTVDSLLGIAYVVEGSTLGGQILARHVTKALGPQTGLFLAAYGEDVRCMWQEFRDAFENYCARSAFDKEEITKSAIATFVNLEKWMSQ